MDIEHEPLDSTARDAAKSKEELERHLKREREIEDFKFLMSQVQGRRFVWRLLEKAGVFRTSFSVEALQMAFAEGNRNLGLLLVSEINELCPEQYQRMMREQKSAKRERSGS